MKLILAIILVGLCWGANTNRWDNVDKVLFVNQFYLSMYDVRQTIEWDKSYQRGESEYREETNPFAVPLLDNHAAFYAAALGGQYLFFRILDNIESSVARKLLLITFTALEYQALEVSDRSLSMVYGWRF